MLRLGFFSHHRAALLLSSVLLLLGACSRAHGRPDSDSDAGPRGDDAAVEVLEDAGVIASDAGLDAGPRPLPSVCALTPAGVAVGEGCFCMGPVVSNGDVVYRQSVGIEVFDVQNPRLPELVRVVSERGGSSGGLATLRGALLLSATNFAPLNIYSLTDPLDPQLVGMLEIDAGFGENVVVSGDLAVVLVRDEHRAFRVDLVDVSDPTEPTLVGSIDLGLRYLPAMAVLGDRVLGVALPSEMTDPPVLVELDLVARTARMHTLFDGDFEIAPVGLAVDGDLVYVIASDGLLRVYENVGDAWVVRGQMPGFGWPFALEVRDGRAIVSSEIGLSVIDVRDPSAFRVIGRSADVGAGGYIISREDAVYLSSGGNLGVVELTCE